MIRTEFSIFVDNVEMSRYYTVLPNYNKKFYNTVEFRVFEPPYCPPSEFLAWLSRYPIIIRPFFALSNNKNMGN